MKSIYKKLIKKNDNGVNNVEKLQNKSTDELKGIAKLRRIKNREKLKKEDLFIRLLKSESSNAEREYMKHLNNNTNDNNKTSRLETTITNNDKKKIKKELHEIDKKQNLSDKEKEEIYDHLVELLRTLDKKERYKYNNRDDPDYYEIRDIENLFDYDNNNNNYYMPILVKSSFKNNYKYYERRGDKDKNYQ